MPATNNLTKEIVMHIYDKNFKYVNAASTNIEKTFARIRKELAEAAKKKPVNVMPIKKALKK